mgnify:CR=1 FL=1
MRGMTEQQELADSFHRDHGRVLFLLSATGIGIEGEQAQGVQRHDHCCSGIGEDRDPQAGDTEHAGDEEYSLEPQCDPDVLVNIRHRGPRQPDQAWNIADAVAQQGGIGRFERDIGA